ncbi:hypothetical protein TELCIR_19966 [Teladorsagia circumcincta]|uniref:Uncharacterized protein n=1 Tax=Teladorsagia circumcincta TaxID=45464 RepID=A0A2G9TKS2_TELCI|nr:hypothetical protein TELCIR_19966 [Teladorsagia circumcincta]
MSNVTVDHPPRLKTHMGNGYRPAKRPEISSIAQRGWIIVVLLISHTTVVGSAANITTKKKGAATTVKTTTTTEAPTTTTTIDYYAYVDDDYYGKNASNRAKLASRESADP